MKHLLHILASLCIPVFLSAQSLNEQTDMEIRDTLKEARVTAEVDRNANATQTGLQKIDGSGLNRGFAFLGTPDLVKTLQMLPGVASGSELMSGLYVHGGTGADNLFLLDGVPLYQVSHLAGLFSSFNTEVVDHLDFYKSGFPARYGGRLSSVVDVTTRRGDMNEYHGMFSIGLTDGNIQFEGPIVKGRTSFNIALRRTWLDLVTTPVIALMNKKHPESEQVKMNYAFWDGNIGLAHKIDDRNLLTMNFYMGRDNLDIKLNDDEELYGLENEYYIYNTDIRLNWGNILASLNWESEMLDNLHSKVSLYYSNNRSRISIGLEEMQESESGSHSMTVEGTNMTRVNDFALKADMDWYPHPAHHVRFGAAYQFHFYTPERVDRQSYSESGVTPIDITMSDGSTYWGHEPAVYIEDEIDVCRWFKANVGFRYSMFAVPGKVYHGFEPRLALSFRLSDVVNIRASYTDMNQFNHQIATSYMDLPTNTWMPVTARMRPMHSRQVAGGLYLSLPQNVIFNIEGYYKTMDNLLEYTGTNTFYPPLNEWETSFSVGRGRSYGMEVELSWRTSKLDMAAYYTLSWNERNFQDIYPLWYPDRHDNRHKLTLVGSWKVGRKADIYAAWNYHTGNRMTSYSHVVSDEGYHEYYYTSPNNIIMPDYHRLDVGFNFRKTTRRGNESVWNLSIYNVYCRMNPFFAMITDDGMGGFTGVGIGIVPIIPSFSYTLRF